jgi:hypothetical protein
MKKQLIRTMFVMLPAVAVGMALWAITGFNLSAAIASTAFMAALGWGVTEPRKDRGED